MGLDMYFEADLYAKDRVVTNEIHVRHYASTDTVVIPKGLVRTITVEVGYLRKANAIHAWLVENIQNGKDECQRSNFDSGSIDELEQLIKQVLEDHNLAGALLPTESGFFFGSTGYDDWYFQYLEVMLDILQDCKKLETLGYEIYYQASW